MLTLAATPGKASVLVLASTGAWDPQTSLAYLRPVGLSPPPAWGPNVSPETQSSQAQGVSLQNRTSVTASGCRN